MSRPDPNRRPLRVLIVTPVYPPIISVGGGVAITYAQLYDRMIARGHKVTVLSPRLFNADHGISNLYPGQPAFLPTIANLKMFHRHFCSNDVVVCPDNTMMPFLIFFSHLTSTPLQFNLHTNFRMVLEGGSFVGRNFIAPLMDNSLNLLTRVTPQVYTTSPSYLEVLNARGFAVDGVFSPRIKLGVFEKSDTEAEIDTARGWLTEGATEAQKRCVLLFIGRWSHEKRIHLLGRCKPSDCCVVIVGDGPKSEADRIEALHDPPNGVFVKRGMLNQDALRVLYKASDYLVSASAFETLGMTVAEAHLCGTPCIVQAASGFVTQVVEGKNGYLVDYEDTEVTKALITKYIASPINQDVLKKHVEERWDTNVPNLEDVVEKLALLRKDEWRCNKPPMWLFKLIIVLYYVAFRVMSYPFLLEKKYVIDRRGKLKIDPGASEERDKKTQ